MSKDPDIFPETEWSMILDAASREPDRVRRGIQRICENYHPVILRWFQARVSYSEAQDLTQEFLLKLLHVTAPGEGFLEFCRGTVRFRNFLSVALGNSLKQAYRREAAQKRGGGVTHCELDEAMTVAKDRGGPTSIDLELARELHCRALTVAMARFSPGSAGGAVARLSDFVHDGTSPDYAQMTAELGVSTAVLRTTLMRLRRHYHSAFRNRVAEFTMPDQVADEHFYLLSLLAEHGVLAMSPDRERQWPNLS